MLLDGPSGAMAKEAGREATGRPAVLCGMPSRGSLTAYGAVSDHPPDTGADRDLQATTRVPHIPEAT